MKVSLSLSIALALVACGQAPRSLQSAPASIQSPPAPVQGLPENFRSLCTGSGLAEARLEVLKEAAALGIKRAEVEVAFNITEANEIKDVRVVRSTHAMFEPAAVDWVKRYKCVSPGKEVTLRQAFSFRIE